MPPRSTSPTTKSNGHTRRPPYLFDLLILAVVPLSTLALFPAPTPPNPSGADLDPRIELIRLQAADRLEEALEAVDSLLKTPVPSVDPDGVDYLRGHLLSKLRRNQEAAKAFAAVVGSPSPLSEYARMRIAELQEELGFASAAAALATDVLAASPPSNLADRALPMLARTLEGGGDCRLLTRLQDTKFRKPQRRQLALIQARCGLRETQGQGKQLLARILAEDHRDLQGLLAADLLFPLLKSSDPPSLRTDLAQAFHHHRRFELAVPLLREQVPITLPPIRNQTDFDLHFQMIRGLFWQGKFKQSARGYRQLATRSSLAKQKAEALYHRSRSLELAGRWTEATSSYIATHNADPDGTFAGAGLLGSLRLYSRSGQSQKAVEQYKALSSTSSLRNERTLAALFLASSRLSVSRTNDVSSLLNDAELHGKTVPSLYWRGRLAELEGKPSDAVERYLQALGEDYFHPLAQLGLQRLDQDLLRATALSMGQDFAQAKQQDFSTWILLGSQNPLGRNARDRLEKTLLRRSRQSQLAPTTAVPIEDWPLWKRTRTTPQELLLSFGIWTESGAAARRLFPPSQPNLTFTAAIELQRAGRTQESLLIVESLAKRIRKGTPDPLVPAVFRRALYPFAYQFLIEQAGRHFRIDPLLLTAIIREESRFNPQAASGAAARGLAQFIIPTAERLANQIGREGIAPNDLDQPDIAVTLGAAYLRELSDRFNGRPEMMLAAYNAGEAQAEVWGLHCRSSDPAEYITKISFSETRNYVTKVLRSYAQYLDLYPDSVI